jgi:hypothetical protein
MKTFGLVSFLVLSLLLNGGCTQQQGIESPGNAAPYYRSAFAQMQDIELNAQEAKMLIAVVEGKADYDETQFKTLLDNNLSALKTMEQGTALPYCAWGIDYALGHDTPVDYVRMALTLGRLNVLHTYSLLSAGDMTGAVRALIAGLRFSTDISEGGTLFAALASKNVLDAHLNVIESVMKSSELSDAQVNSLRQSDVLTGARKIDWFGAIDRELDILQNIDPGFAEYLSQIRPQYLNALQVPSALRELRQTISKAPQSLADLIPSPERVVAQKQELDSRLQKSRLLLNPRRVW